MKKVLEEKIELEDGSKRYTYTDGQSYVLHTDGTSESITPITTIQTQGDIKITSDNKGKEPTVTTQLGALRVRQIKLSNGGIANIKVRKNGTFKTWSTDHVHSLVKNGCLYLS
ncbi:MULTISPECIES: hypothetical protein [Vibrio]|uniref:Uncharacterized protein n=2 Tax=Vibrio TaxID=662 RepID=A0A7X4LJU4_9VIBR|nr:MULTISPECIES: hypothetical protein [Vibrio]MBF9000479.1 hypothetical protein [Vibrio nitrifigilis]MZI93254.1 hypothetical protein [Vibrio eleionomae]